MWSSVLTQSFLFLEIKLCGWFIYICVCQITELLTDVERLKQALNGLSQLAYTSNTPNKRQTQHIDTLQAQIKSLQQQLAVSEHMY